MAYNPATGKYSGWNGQEWVDLQGAPKTTWEAAEKSPTAPTAGGETPTTTTPVPEWMEPGATMDVTAESVGLPTIPGLNLSAMPEAWRVPETTRAATAGRSRLAQAIHGRGRGGAAQVERTEPQ